MDGLEPPLGQEGRQGPLGFFTLNGFFTLPSGIGAQTIHQWPPVRVQLVGSLLSLECTVKGTSSPYLYWYWQSLGGTPQLLFSSLSVDQIVRETQQNFTAFRPQDGQFILSSEKLLLSDSGFYLCAWSLTLRWVG